MLIIRKIFKVLNGTITLTIYVDNYHIFKPAINSKTLVCNSFVSFTALEQEWRDFVILHVKHYYCVWVLDFPVLICQMPQVLYLSLKRQLFLCLATGFLTFLTIRLKMSSLFICLSAGLLTFLTIGLKMSSLFDNRSTGVLTFLAVGFKMSSLFTCLSAGLLTFLTIGLKM